MATFAGLTYTNGNVPADILAPLDDQPYALLREDAAEAWNRARRDVFNRTGVVLTVRGWNRTLAEQEKFFLERYRPQATGGGPYGDVRWWRGTRYVRYGTASAAIPGTSNHGWGLAVDVVDYGSVNQFNYPRRVATFPILALHGWTDTEGRRPDTLEPWHLVYDPARDTHPEVDDMDVPTLEAVLDRKLKDLPDMIWGKELAHPAGTKGVPAVIWLIDGRRAAGDAVNAVKQLGAAIAGLDLTVDVDEDALAAAFAAAVPADIADRVIDRLHERTAPAGEQ